MVSYIHHSEIAITITVMLHLTGLSHYVLTVAQTILAAYLQTITQSVYGTVYLAMKVGSMERRSK